MLIARHCQPCQVRREESLRVLQEQVLPWWQFVCFDLAVLLAQRLASLLALLGAAWV